jgi:hypothetical protein
MQRDPEQRYPVGEILPSLGIHPLPEAWEPVEAFLLIKCRDSNGDDQSWVYRITRTLNREELLGALMVQVDILRRELANDWVAEDNASS